MDQKSVRTAKKRATKRGRYVYGDKLGEGSFGTVLKAFDKQNEVSVAIKILEYRKSSREEDELLKADARKEVEILKKLKHDHIIRIIDHFEFQKYLVIPQGLAIVMEYCPNGTLSHLLAKMSKKGTFVPKENRLKWYKQLLSALVYIHSKFIAHRDLKPENVLVDGKNELKIADVGISKVLFSEEAKTDVKSLYMKTMAGTYSYMAPEVFENRYTMKSDVFSMGLIMFVICELPPSLIPQIKTDKIQTDLPGLPGSEAFTCDGLGNYYSSGESGKSTEVLYINRAQSEEKKLFNEMLCPEYKNRPKAIEVFRKLEEMEEIWKRQDEIHKKYMRWSKYFGFFAVFFIASLYVYFLLRYIWK